MKRNILKILGVLTLALIAIALPLLSSYEIREWAADTLFPSQIYNAQPVPHFTPFNPAAAALRFIAVGDVGTGGRGQRQVAGAMAQVAGADSISFVVLLGDNFYERGVRSITDPQWLVKFESMYHHPSLQIPFLAILGNHDYDGNPQAQVEYTATSRRWVMPSRFYSRSFTVDDSTDVALFLLDTNPMSQLSQSDIMKGKDSAAYRAQLDWLETELGRSEARWKIVAGHHTIYSNGDHGNNPGLGSLLEPLFVRYGVDAYLAGHEHDLQLLGPVQGVHYIVSGGGGKDRSVEWKGNTLFAATRLGFVRMTITHTSASVEFFNRDGVLTFVYEIPKLTRQ
ncbi:MAG: tartrate-resistant acid phosphatase type 5 family protein [Bacteroidota bacterium]